MVEHGLANGRPMVAVHIALIASKSGRLTDTGVDHCMKTV